MRSGNIYHIVCYLLLVITLLWLDGCAPSRLTEEQRKIAWVDSTVNSLSLEEKLGQMFSSRAYGYYYSDQSEEFKRLERIVRDRKVGGLIFFQGDPYETAIMVNRMQQIADVPLLISSDFEWGTAMRVRRATRFPDAMAVGATRDTALAFAMGKAIGEETRAIGVRQDYAPVADVNVNPNNPVINTRSFGEDPKLVADMACAFTAGLQTAGVLATAKHFPGHGDTQTDSHLDLPLVYYSRPHLDSVELFPFRRLIDCGVSSVMVGHLEVPALEDEQKLPATLSPIIIDSVLKKQLGFGGLVVTDAMDMSALVNYFGADSAAVKAVEAGIDVLLNVPEEERAIAAVVEAVRAGRISQYRIDQSVRKILGYKWSLGLAENRFADINNLPNVVGIPSHVLIAKRIVPKRP